MVDVGKRFSLHCDLDGRVVQVLNDENKILPPDLAGKMFFSTVVSGDLDKILNFFVELKKEGTALGWEININTLSGVETFLFFGGIFGDRIGLAAATTKNGAQSLFSELTRINNEQTNIIRAVSKEFARIQALSSEEPGVVYYEELSRLNNELVNMQRELAKKNRELDELNKLKNQFLGIAAHDLRNPLGVVLGYSELLLDEDYQHSSEEMQEMLGSIHQTAKFMLSLVNDLLDIANIESGKLELNISEQDFNRVVLETLKGSEIFAKAKSMKLLFHQSSFPLEVRMDRPKIEQVIGNLVSNAIKYSYPGSTIELSLERKGDYARFVVRDYGQGIREEELAKLFKPFQKASSKSTAGEKSTGLGLSIVKKIVEAHQGEAGVTSQLGEGSAFFFTLPFKSS